MIMDELNLITFNDDNHAERVWLNGKYVGTAKAVDRPGNKCYNLYV